MIIKYELETSIDNLASLNKITIIIKILIPSFISPGFPNVGKSSVINSLVGKKVVSVSRTPGHTKYFQTYYLTQTVKLCDCPGLVFPSRVSKQLQVQSYVFNVLHRM